MRDAAVCHECLLKFNEYDEYQRLSAQIHQEISTLFFSNLNEQEKEEEIAMFPVEPKTELVDPIEDITYETLPGLQNNINYHKMVFAQEVTESDLPYNVMDLGEVDEIDRKKLPRKLQATQKGEKQKVLKTHSIKSERESFTIVQLENNVRLYQCEICSRTFKEKSKLKAHKEIHTTERNVSCPTCGKAFKTAACLRSHKRVHNPTVIECDFCGKTYTQKPELIKHINFVHFNR